MNPSLLRATASAESAQTMFVLRLAILWVSITLVMGCASREVLIVAQANPAYRVSTTNFYCLAGGESDATGETGLIPALKRHLNNMGVELKPMPDADYSIACWMDTSHESIGSYRNPFLTTYAAPPYASTRWGVTYDPPMSAFTPYPGLITTAVRIRVYPTRVKNIDQLAPAWDAFADPGIRVSEQRASQTLKAMLEHWGEDFQSTVNLDNIK